MTTAVIWLLIFASPAFARRPPPPSIFDSLFDGNRQGFIIGFGLGTVPHFTNPPGEWKETGTRLGLHLMLGRGWDESNTTVLEWHYAGPLMRELPNKYFPYGRVLRQPPGQCFGGLTWYHYFGSERTVGFTALGLGTCGNPDDGEDVFYGPGLLTGVGVQIIKYVQLTAYGLLGKHHGGKRKFGYSFLTIMLTAVAY